MDITTKINEVLSRPIKICTAVFGLGSDVELYSWNNVLFVHASVEGFHDGRWIDQVVVDFLEFISEVQKAREDQHLKSSYRIIWEKPLLDEKHYGNLEL